MRLDIAILKSIRRLETNLCPLAIYPYCNHKHSRCQGRQLLTLRGSLAADDDLIINHPKLRGCRSHLLRCSFRLGLLFRLRFVLRVRIVFLFSLCRCTVFHSGCILLRSFRIRLCFRLGLRLLLRSHFGLFLRLCLCLALRHRLRSFRLTSQRLPLGRGFCHSRTLSLLGLRPSVLHLLLCLRLLRPGLYRRSRLRLALYQRLF